MIRTSHNWFASMCVCQNALNMHIQRTCKDNTSDRFQSRANHRKLEHFDHIVHTEDTSWSCKFQDHQHTSRMDSSNVVADAASIPSWQPWWTEYWRFNRFDLLVDIDQVEMWNEWMNEQMWTVGTHQYNSYSITLLVLDRLHDDTIKIHRQPSGFRMQWAYKIGCGDFSDNRAK